MLRFLVATSVLIGAIFGILTAAEAQSDATISPLVREITQLSREERYDEAEVLAKRTLEVSENIFGDAHPETLKIVGILGRIAQARGSFGDAESWFRRALETVYSGDAGEMYAIEQLRDFANLYSELEEYGRAAPYIESALLESEQVFGPSHSNTVDLLAELGTIHEKLGRFDLAEVEFNRAVAAGEQTLGGEHRAAVAVSLSGLARIHTTAGRYDVSEPLYKRALQANERLFGKENSATLRNISELVGLYNVQGKSLDELKLYLSAKGIAISNVCLEKNGCTPVRIFFGTNRKADSSIEGMGGFGADRSDNLILGQAVITVPKTTDRKKGEIRRPTWWDRIYWGTPPAGDPLSHFTILRDGFALFRDESQFLRATRNHMKEAGDYRDHALVFIHGYNTTFESALYRTAQIAYDLGYDEAGGTHVPFGMPYMFSWPSSGESTGYLYDQDSASLAVKDLKEFLQLVLTRTGAKRVNIIAHSMGNVALLKALSNLQMTTRSVAAINQIILAAPDLDVAEFENLAASITSLAAGVTLYASSSDRAIMAAREIRRGAPRAGDVPAEGPVVVKDIYSIDISTLNTEIFTFRHSDYAESKIILNDMNRIFTKGEQPPHSRNINFARRQRGKMEYWRYMD